MNRIVIIALFICSNSFAMDLFYEEFLEEQSKEQQDNLPAGLVETLSPLSSSPEKEWHPLDEEVAFKAHAFFFCSLCNIRISQDQENPDLIEHLIIVHNTCVQCSLKFKKIEQVRQHIIKDHKKSVEHPQAGVPLIEQIIGHTQKKVTFE